jgi:hypothetical protein
MDDVTRPLEGIKGWLAEKVKTRLFKFKISLPWIFFTLGLRQLCCIIRFWDDWLREPEQRKGRACIIPEVNRYVAENRWKRKFFCFYLHRFFRAYTFGDDGVSM